MSTTATPPKVGLGAIICPPGIPQAACDFASTYLQTQPNLPPGFDPTNVLNTFKQWWAVLNPGQPSLPTDPGSYFPGQQAAALLQSAVTFWTQFAAANPGLAQQINPGAWDFPWQFVRTGPISVGPGINTALPTIQDALQGMMTDASASATLNGGRLPTFDATKVSWGGLPWASNINTFAQIANDVAGQLPQLKQFVTAGSHCRLFSQNTGLVAMTAYPQFIASNSDPCSLVVQPPAPLPPTPAPSPSPNPAPTSVGGSTNNTFLYVGLAVAGTAAVGLAIYVMTRPKTPSMAHEFFAPNPSAGLAHWRALTTDKLQNKYGMDYQSIMRVLDLPYPDASSRTTLSQFLQAHHVSPTKAAARINELWMTQHPLFSNNRYPAHRL